MNPIAEELRAFTATDTGAENIAAETIHECLRAVMHHAAPTNPPPVGAVPPVELPAQVPGKALPAAGMVTLHLCRALRGYTHIDAINTDLPARYAAWAVLEAISAGKRVAR